MTVSLAAIFFTVLWFQNGALTQKNETLKLYLYTLH